MKERRQAAPRCSQQRAGTIPDDLHADTEQDERAQAQQNVHSRLPDHPAQPLSVAIRDKHRGGHESHADQYRGAVSGDGRSIALGSWSRQRLVARALRPLLRALWIVERNVYWLVLSNA